MASAKVVEEAVREAVTTASVDREASSEEMVAFEPHALARVAKLYGETGGVDLVIQAWSRVRRDSILSGDMDSALATFVLRDRLRKAGDVQYELVEGRWQRLAGREVSLEEDPWNAEGV